MFARGWDVGAVGFALAQVPRGGTILWVQDHMAARETGRSYGPALGRFGGDPEKLVFARGRTAAEVLWTMEEGLKCTALAAVIGEIWGDPRALGFTATKRLTLAAERRGVHVFLLRFGASVTLSLARQRWRVGSAVSDPHPHDPRAPGNPRWRAELFRAREMPPGLWEVSYDAAAHRLDLAAPFRDPVLAQTRADGAGAG